MKHSKQHADLKFLEFKNEKKKKKKKMSACSNAHDKCLKEESSVIWFHVWEFVFPFLKSLDFPEGRKGEGRVFYSTHNLHGSQFNTKSPKFQDDKFPL